MTPEQIQERLRAALIKVTDRDPGVVPHETDLREGLGLDSFAALELMFELEDDLGVRIPREAVTGFRTVGDVVAFVAQAQSAGPQVEPQPAAPPGP